jgi:hypothetical protein
MSNKKIKFGKPFSSFNQSRKYTTKPLSEKWKIALQDPIYLILFSVSLITIIVWLIKQMI